LHEHGILLATMMIVSGLITYLLRRQKELAVLEHLQARRMLQLMQWSETLREADEPQHLLPRLHELISSNAGEEVRFVLGFQQPEHPAPVSLNTMQQEGFAACLKENRSMGRHTGRYDNLEDIYLPMRGKFRAHGACVCIGIRDNAVEIGWIEHVQALMDQMGLACERREQVRRAQEERESAQAQITRSLFLTSIAHDQRTPLASIMTAASAIREQGDRLNAHQVKQFADLIYCEAGQVLRLTDNTLTLARLNGEQVEVPMQDESAEDIVAAVLQRIRQRNFARLPKVQVEAALPLVTCNMVLVEQVLDNLLDNATQHSGAPDTVELQVHRVGDEACFKVSDQGRGMDNQQPPSEGDHRRGLGIGLQLCRVVAEVHGGRLTLDSTAGNGTLASFCLPLKAAGVARDGS
jgi:two-component system, OmpR family, sensor histidine kinase KdpD